MLRTRAIPCLLLKGQGLVKTERFRGGVYLGDPINAVRIFNDKEVDELVFLDITATSENRPPNFVYLARIASQCFMPLCYGGGVRSLEEMTRLYKIGIEKVALNTAAVERPSLVKEAGIRFGSQSVVVAIDVKKSWLGRHQVYVHSGTRNTGLDPVQHAIAMAEAGAGEIFLNSIDCDGTMKGYDLELIKRVSSAVQIPVIACGGAGKLEHLVQAVEEGGAAAAAAGSLFVFQVPNRAVLINYPNPQTLSSLWETSRGHD